MLRKEEIVSNLQKRVEDHKSIFEETGSYLYFNNEVAEEVKGLLNLYHQEKEKNKITANDIENLQAQAYMLGRKDENEAMKGVIQIHYISKDKIKKLIEENCYIDTYNFKTIPVDKLLKLLED